MLPYPYLSPTPPPPSNHDPSHHTDYPPRLPHHPTVTHPTSTTHPTPCHPTNTHHTTTHYIIFTLHHPHPPSLITLFHSSTHTTSHLPRSTPPSISLPTLPSPTALPSFSTTSYHLSPSPIILS